MPPKKRGRPPVASSTAPQYPKKKVRVGETSVIGRQESSEVTESGRPKRSSAGEPSYNKTRAKAPDSKQNGTSSSATMAKTSVAERSKAKARNEGSTSSVDIRKESKTAKVDQQANQALKRKPGRPKTFKANAGITVQKNGATQPEVAVERPKKAVGSITKQKDKEVKSGKTATAKQKAPNASAGDTLREEAVGSLPNDVSNHLDDDEESQVAESGRQFWLMKAEPESRIEKGVDVKFSIDDLEAKGAAESWDGVRNYGARNNMRAMRKGDYAFFYHSNCKVPGIVGVMEITEEHRFDGMSLIFHNVSPFLPPPLTPLWDRIRFRPRPSLLRPQIVS